MAESACDQRASSALPPGGATTVQREPLTDAIVRAAYAPSLITSIANSFMYGGSRVYFQKFGVRINEWRVMNTLAARPGAVATEISTTLGLDKGVISRTVSSLEKNKLIIIEREVGAKRLYLTNVGVSIQRQIVPLSRRRLQELLKGFSDAETAEFMGYLGRATDNLQNLREFDQELIHEVGQARETA